MSVGALVLAAMLVAASGLAASRQASQAPAITSFTPARGPIGTSVTIVGTNLSGASVAFNNVSANAGPGEAPAEEGAGTQIVAIVPTGATTGLISITTAHGSTKSFSPFTVTAAPAAGTRPAKPAPVNYFTFKRQVKLQPGQTLHFKKGKGYYAALP
jgi:hypothetical protein